MVPGRLLTSMTRCHQLAHHQSLTPWDGLKASSAMVLVGIGTLTCTVSDPISPNFSRCTAYEVRYGLSLTMPRMPGEAACIPTALPPDLYTDPTAP